MIHDRKGEKKVLLMFPTNRQQNTGKKREKELKIERKRTVHT